MPYIVSRYAVTCCLKSKAGFLGSTTGSMKSLPTLKSQLPLIRVRCNKNNSIAQLESQ
ncbi:hypothetical protein LINPERHAP1_LOCUS3349 [Linum perenne]